MLLSLCGAPLAAPLLGTLAQVLGARAPIIAGRVICALTAIMVWVLLRRRAKLLPSRELPDVPPPIPKIAPHPPTE